jgi:hypothetical protein
MFSSLSGDPGLSLLKINREMVCEAVSLILPLLPKLYRDHS